MTQNQDEGRRMKDEKGIGAETAPSGRQQEDYADDYADDDGEGVCDGCGRGEYDSGHCPLCCSHMYSPGTEECDFCEYSDECREHARRLR